mgnify:CR=1 FL=1
MRWRSVIGARGQFSAAQAYADINQRGFLHPVATGSRNRNRNHNQHWGTWVPAAKQSKGQSLLGLGLLVWPFICWLAARLAHDLSGGRRTAYWVTFFVLLLLPWTNTFIRYGVAASYYVRVGRLMPEAPIVAPGFLAADEQDHYQPPLSAYLVPPHGSFEFVEVRFTNSVREMPSMVYGPGFYQFRLADSSVPECSTFGVSGKPVGVYAHDAHCYTYTRSDRPMSRYALVSEPEERLWSGVIAQCMKIVDLHDQSEVARSCWFSFDVFPIGSHTVGSRSIYADMLAVLQSQSDLSH